MTEIRRLVGKAYLLRNKSTGKVVDFGNLDMP